VAAQAGVTVGALYHHFRSKQGFYGLLRDEMTQRVVDRVEAAAEAAPAKQRLRAATLAAYDGVLRTRAGKLLTEPDPRGAPDGLALALSAVAAHGQAASAEMLGAILAAAVRAALVGAGDSAERQALARSALQSLLPPG
jgi:AcrR family transcriptional regulator